MPRMILKLDGETYVGKASDEMTMEAGTEAFYTHVNQLDRLKMPLEDGSMLIIGSDLIKRALFVIQPDNGTGNADA